MTTTETAFHQPTRAESLELAHGAIEAVIRNGSDQQLLEGLTLAAEMLMPFGSKVMYLPHDPDSWQVMRVNRVWLGATAELRKKFYFSAAVRKASVPPVAPPAKKKRKRTKMVKDPVILQDTVGYIGAVEIDDSKLGPMGHFLKAAAAAKSQSVSA